MSKALYRKYRSTSLDEVVGQSHVTELLKRALAQDKVAHAYLLTGPRGVGKTSIARILAHEINSLPYSNDGEHLDIIEIDAASNNGVDDVRDLREKVQVTPVAAIKKVYIIDEVHMLSKPAFNALLKTLEEPPEHVVFILATTNVEKLPDTIISRTQRFGLRAITPSVAKVHLKTIADKEKLKISDDALDMIAQRGDGSFRDSISLLDQLSSLAANDEGITAELVENTLGLAPRTLIDQLLDAVSTQDGTMIIRLLDTSEQQGVQATVLIDQLISTIRHQIVEKPELAPLLDKMLDARESSKPAIKLLTVLLSVAAPKPKVTTAALSVALPSVAAPIAELKKPTPVIKVTPAQPAKPARRPVQQPAKSTPDEPARVPVAPMPENFDWSALVEHARSNYLALHSVLSKCSPEIDGTTLRLYTARQFNKTKLDETKYRGMLSICLVETGAGDMEIETIPTPPPPSDETAASVAAIMGGGEQVNVEG